MTNINIPKTRRTIPAVVFFEASNIIPNTNGKHPHINSKHDRHSFLFISGLDKSIFFKKEE